MAWRYYYELIRKHRTEPEAWLSAQWQSAEVPADALRRAVRESDRGDVTRTLIGLRRTSDALFAFAVQESSDDRYSALLHSVVEDVFSIMVDELLQEDPE